MQQLLSEPTADARSMHCSRAVIKVLPDCAQLLLLRKQLQVISVVAATDSTACRNADCDLLTVGLEPALRY
jgi:hypothetical protein